jgi:hypothetical protein
LPAVLSNQLSIVLTMPFVPVWFSHCAIRDRNIVAPHDPDLFALTTAAVTLSSKHERHFIICGAEGANMAELALSVGF